MEYITLISKLFIRWYIKNLTSLQMGNNMMGYLKKKVFIEQII